MTDGITVKPGPGIPEGLTVPESDLEERFSKSSGPGGQSVNTTDSRVEVVLDLAATSALDDEQRARAIRQLGRRLSVTASEHRSQHRNRVAARKRIGEQLRAALAPPPLPRVPTKPTKGSQRRRVEGKRRRSQVKSLRGRVRDD